MKRVALFSCLSAIALLAACGPTDGYYDSRGNYHHRTTEDRSVTPGFSGDSYRHNNYYTDASARRGDSKRVVDYDSRRDLDRISYKRAGYYDSYGHYIPADRPPVVDGEYYPPRGKCRVWFVDRPYDDQPPVESCTRIQYRVPYGAYVIYGG